MSTHIGGFDVKTGRADENVRAGGVVDKTGGVHEDVRAGTVVDKTGGVDEDVRVLLTTQEEQMRMSGCC